MGGRAGGGREGGGRGRGSLVWVDEGDEKKRFALFYDPCMTTKKKVSWSLLSRLLL